MTRQRFDPAGEQGFTLFYTAACLTGLLLFVGLAVDSGRAYVVKAQLSKAVDGAALGAARMLNSGDPRGEAERLFRANFETGYLGTSSVTDPSADPNFFSLQTIPATGVNIVTIQASAVRSALRTRSSKRFRIRSRMELPPRSMVITGSRSCTVTMRGPLPQVSTMCA